MKLKILGLTAGAALLALHSTTASADADVWIGLDIGIPAPVVVERRPVHYYEHETDPVYYHDHYAPRTTYVYERHYYDYDHERHHHGHHKPYKYKHKRKHRHHH